MYMMLYVLAMLAFLDLFVQFPIMSPYAQSLGAEPIMIGSIVGGYSLTNLCGNLIAGWWIDRFEARRILWIGMVLTGVIVTGYCFVDSPQQLLGLRLLHGFSGGLLAPSAFALISNQAFLDGKSQGKTMAFSGASVGAAAIIGPALAGILKGQLGVDAVFMTVAGLMFVGSAMIIAIGHKITPSVSTAARDPQTLSEWLPHIINSRIWPSYLGAFSLMFAMGILTYMLPLQTDALQLGERAAGLLLSSFGVVAIILFVLPTNRIFDRVHILTALWLGFVCISIALAVLSMSTELVEFIIAMCVYGVGFALVFPAMTKNIAVNTEVKHRGKAFGLFYSIYSIGVVAGSFIIGFLAVSPQGAFIIGTVFMAAVSLILIFFKRMIVIKL